MPTTIVSAGTIAPATGFSTQSHLIYAVNDAAWWMFFIDSSSTTIVQCYRSPDLTTWTAKTSLTIGSSRNHNNDSRCIAVAYANISSNDVVGLCGQYGVGGSQYYHYCRATISSGTITWGTDSELGNQGITANIPLNSAIAFDSGNKIFVSANQDGDLFSYKSTNADSGSSWTSGFGSQTAIDTSYTNVSNRVAMFPLASGKILFVGEDASATEPNSMKNVLSKTWDGTTLSPTPASTAGTSIFTALGSGIAPGNFGAVRVSNTDVHCVLRTGSNTYVHKRFNGTNWTTVSGASITNQNSVAGSGPFLCTDGTDVWLFIIDSDSANTVRYVKWTASGNTWGTWTALETSSQTRNYLSGYPLVVSNTIAVIWSQTNGSNFDIVVTSLSLSANGTLIKSVSGDNVIKDTSGGILIKAASVGNITKGGGSG